MESSISFILSLLSDVYNLRPCYFTYDMIPTTWPEVRCTPLRASHLYLWVWSESFPPLEPTIEIISIVCAHDQRLRQTVRKSFILCTFDHDMHAAFTIEKSRTNQFCIYSVIRYYMVWDDKLLLYIIVQVFCTVFFQFWRRRTEPELLNELCCIDMLFMVCVDLNGFTNKSVLYISSAFHCLYGSISSLGRCRETNIVYKETVTSTHAQANWSGNEDTETYVGLKETEIKTRLANHKQYFNNPKLLNSTELSQFIWKLKTIV